MIAISGTLPENTTAAANLTAYKSVPPNGWEPLGYNVTGTAPYYVTHTLGWNDVKLMGNVGLGNGGVNYLNATSKRDIGYTDNNIMAGDISTAPWDPRRLNGTPTPASSGIPAGGEADKLANMPLKDRYHSILLGRPVDDLAYEYPLAPAISAYFRLAGIPMPCGGGLAGVSIKCLGYGY